MTLPDVDVVGLAFEPLHDIPDEEGATAGPGTGRTDELAPAPALSTCLDDLTQERPESEAEAGSTPLPTRWRLLRAVMGRATRKQLEAAAEQGQDGPAARAVEAAARRGRLSAGIHVNVGITGGGKTAFAANLTRAAIEEGHPVVYVSLELDPDEVAARLVALDAAEHNGSGELSWADLTERRPLTPNVRAERDRAIRRLRERLSAVHVWAPDAAVDPHPPTVAQLRRMVYEAAARYGKAPLVVFDYLQAPGFYGVSAAEERRLPIRERIGAIIIQLRHLSKRHQLKDGTLWPGCPVLILSTTARGNVGGERAAKGMTGEDPDEIRFESLEVLKALPKEAGEIEATAVTAWAMALAETPDEDGARSMTLRLAKFRKGPVGQWIPLRLYGATGRIMEEPGRFVSARAGDAAAAREAEASTNGIRTSELGTSRPGTWKAGKKQPAKGAR